METVKYLCEFFFCHFWHFLELVILGVVIFSGRNIIINQDKNSNKDNEDN